MTQEDKTILLQDLAARIPYGVKICINSCIDEQNQMELFDVNFGSKTIGVGNEKWAFRAIPIVDIDDNTKIVRPYLRLMSSMTEEEKREFQSFYPGCFGSQWLDVEKGEIEIFECSSTLKLYLNNSVEIVDWLNAHHFDYRGLIHKRLALEAPADMYK